MYFFIMIRLNQNIFLLSLFNHLCTGCFGSGLKKKNSISKHELRKIKLGDEYELFIKENKEVLYQSPYIVAVKEGDIAELTTLLSKKEPTKKEFDLAVAIATEQSNQPILKLLLMHRSEIKVEKAFDSPLKIATAKGDIQSLKILLDHGNYDEWEIHQAAELAIKKDQLSSFKVILNSREWPINLLISLATECARMNKVPFLTFLLEKGRGRLKRHHLYEVKAQARYEGNQEIVDMINREFSFFSRIKLRRKQSPQN